MNRERSFSLNVTVYASRQSLWETLLSANTYSMAWQSVLETTWERGTSIRFTGTWEEVEYHDKGEVQINHPQSCLQFTYWSSFWNVADTPGEYCMITYTLHPLDIFSCELTITQDGFRDETHYVEMVELWRSTAAIIKYEAEKQELDALSRDVFQKLNYIINEPPAEIYNLPRAGRWNYAQVVQHLVQATAGMKNFLAEGAAGSTDKYDQNIPTIRKMMLNRINKLSTLDFLVPQSVHYVRGEHKRMLAVIQAEINHCIHACDLKQQVTGMALPPFGFMSVFEWLNFSLFHISRHCAQLEDLQAEFSIQTYQH
jgi:hypothetical protein